MSACNCPHIDGYVIVRQSCPHHSEARARWALAKAESVVEVRDPDADDLACAWSDYRSDYGVGGRDMNAAHKAFLAGWKAAREGDQSGVLR